MEREYDARFEPESDRKNPSPAERIAKSFRDAVQGLDQRGEEVGTKEITNLGKALALAGKLETLTQFAEKYPTSATAEKIWEVFHEYELMLKLQDYDYKEFNSRLEKAERSVEELLQLADQLIEKPKVKRYRAD